MPTDVRRDFARSFWELKPKLPKAFGLAPRPDCNSALRWVCCGLVKVRSAVERWGAGWVKREDAGFGAAGGGLLKREVRPLVVSHAVAGGWFWVVDAPKRLPPCVGWGWGWGWFCEAPNRPGPPDCWFWAGLFPKRLELCCCCGCAVLLPKRLVPGA